MRYRRRGSRGRYGRRFRGRARRGRSSNRRLLRIGFRM